jgi:uncharacterized pyridoxamine 5'-phosphate oxidase family protein
MKKKKEIIQVFIATGKAIIPDFGIEVKKGDKVYYKTENNKNIFIRLKKEVNNYGNRSK